MEEANNQFRSYNVDDVPADEVTAWYKQTMSAAPWLLIRSDRYSGDDQGALYTQDCVQVRYTEAGATSEQIYYVEVMGHAGEKSGVHVNIGTPHPITEACKRYSDER